MSAPLIQVDVRDRAHAALLTAQWHLPESVLDPLAVALSGARADGWREGLQGAIAALQAEHTALWGTE